MQKSIFSIALCLLATSVATLGSCTSKVSAYKGKTVHVTYHNKPFDASSLVDGYDRIIPLKATSRNAIIRKIDRLFFSKDRIIVFDKAGKNILAFNENGDFIASTANMIGRGHNEYIQLGDVAFDRRSNEIYAFSNNPQGILVFDTNLKLKRKFGMAFWALEIAMDDKYIYCLRRSKDKAIKSELVALKKECIDGEWYTVMETKKGVIGLRGFGKCLNICNDTLYACLPFDNCIYKISGGKASVICQLDFGSRAAKSLYDNLTYKEFLRKNDDHDWMVMNINVTDSLIQFNTNSYYSFIFNRTSEECHAFRGITTDLLPFSCSKTIPTQGLKGQVVFEISNRSIKNYIKHTRHRLNKEVDTTFINTIDNNGNPTIIVWKER